MLDLSASGIWSPSQSGATLGARFQSSARGTIKLSTGPIQASTSDELELSSVIEALGGKNACPPLFRKKEVASGQVVIVHTEQYPELLPTPDQSLLKHKGREAASWSYPGLCAVSAPAFR